VSDTSPFDQDRNHPSKADALMQELRATLEPSETLLWSGFPAQGIRFSAQDAFLIPFSLVWGGFAIFWEAMALLDTVPASSDAAPIFFPLFGLPFVAIGLYMIFGRFFADAFARARTIYAVTNQRVLILSGVLSRNRRSLELVGLGEINSREKADGGGTITFGAPSPFAAFRFWPGMNRTNPAFEGVARVRDVLKTIRDAQRAASRGGDS
jgi:hypothetical protein